MNKNGGSPVFLHKMHVIYNILLLSVVPSRQKGFWYQIIFNAYNTDHTACTPYHSITIVLNLHALLNIHMPLQQHIHFQLYCFFTHTYLDIPF